MNAYMCVYMVPRVSNLHHLYTGLGPDLSSALFSYYMPYKLIIIVCVFALLCL